MNVLRPEAMPFVNRYEEIFSLLKVHVDNLWRIRHLKDEAVIADYRQLRLPFAGQMYGTGKTSLAHNFVKKLSDPKLADLIEQKLQVCEDPKYVAFFRERWQAAKQSRLVYVDLGASPDLLLLVNELSAKLLKKTSSPSTATLVDATVVEKLTEVVMALHAEQQDVPLLVVIDEAGGLPFQEALQDLRRAVRKVFSRIHAQWHSSSRLPQIHFLVAGKGLHFQELDAGNLGSPLGTAWVTLHMMEVQYITEIREHLQLNASLHLVRFLCFSFDTIPVTPKNFLGYLFVYRLYPHTSVVLYSHEHFTHRMSCTNPMSWDVSIAHFIAGPVVHRVCCSTSCAPCTTPSCLSTPSKTSTKRSFRSTRCLTPFPASDKNFLFRQTTNMLLLFLCCTFFRNLVSRAM